MTRIPEECSTSVLETKRLEYPYDRVNDLKCPVMDSPNLNALVDMDIGSHSLHRDEMSQDVLRGMTYKTDPNAQKQLQTSSPLVVIQSTASSQNGMDTFGATPKCVGRIKVDLRGQSQLLPRYQPRITDQELPQIPGDSNSIITPLFAKILSASDVGRIGRMVLPKKYAEAHFPKIDHLERIPLEVQDADGKEWLFHFRFWPNNQSRIYVLEGVARYMQLRRLQAGDTVTFSRIDPEGKLVIGFRKTASVPPLGQGKWTLKMGSDVSKISEVNAPDSAGSWHTDARLKSFTRRRRKPLCHGAKRKRLGMDHEGIVELKLTWEESQGLLRPPVVNPNVVVVEGHAFEEYEEAPIIGMPTAVTTDQVGSSGLSTQEVSCTQLDEIVPSNKTAGALNKIKHAENYLGKLEDSEGLDILANLAFLADYRIPSSIETTRHPYHRSGCTCIVCTQATTGKEPKHKVTSVCNFCPMLKRCKPLMGCTLEKDTESTRKKLEQLHLPDNSEPGDDLSMSVSLDPCQKVIACEDSADVSADKKPFTPLVNQIDLNVQPEQEDGQFPESYSSSIVKLGSGHHKLYPISYGKASLVRDVSVVVSEEPSEGVRGGNGTRDKLVDCIPHDLCSGAKNDSVEPPCSSKRDFMAANCSYHPSL